MNLNITRPLCFFDLETTGVSVSNDRIVEIAILKLHPDESKESKIWRVNPECPIPPQASAVHGIYDSDVADKPNFKHFLNQFLTLLKMLIWLDTTPIVLIFHYWQRKCFGLK